MAVVGSSSGVGGSLSLPFLVMDSSLSIVEVAVDVVMVDSKRCNPVEVVEAVGVGRQVDWPSASSATAQETTWIGAAASSAKGAGTAATIGISLSPKCSDSKHEVRETPIIQEIQLPT